LPKGHCLTTLRDMAKKAIVPVGKSSRHAPAKGKAKPGRKLKALGKVAFRLREDPALYVVEKNDLVTLEEAARLTGKTPHNIRDYIQRDRIKKFDTGGNIIEHAKNGQLRVSMKELRAFLYLVSQRDEKHHHAGLHPELGFYDVPEHQRTKHVHRLHPYLGKFIPQLVEWFLKRYFKPGNWILDPFMGSGTTLVQANELGMASVGVDISEFNGQIARVKLGKYDLANARREVLEVESRVQSFSNRLIQQDDSSLELSPASHPETLTGLFSTS